VAAAGVEEMKSDGVGMMGKTSAKKSKDDGVSPFEAAAASGCL
jgi:hypothetical protein